VSSGSSLLRALSDSSSKASETQAKLVKDTFSELYPSFLLLFPLLFLLFPFSYFLFHVVFFFFFEDTEEITKHYAEDATTERFAHLSCFVSLGKHFWWRFVILFCF
jgi:hypothetical protein